MRACRTQNAANAVGRDAAVRAYGARDAAEIIRARSLYAMRRARIRCRATQTIDYADAATPADAAPCPLCAAATMFRRHYICLALFLRRYAMRHAH